MAEVKLLGFGGNRFSCRVEIALKLKKITYELVPQDLANKSPLLLEHNPVHKKIPVLLHNGKSIRESRVIFDYIEETGKGNPILPEDPYERAMARFWAKFIDEKKACFSKWIEEFVNCPVVKETLPPKDMLLAFFKANQQPSPKYK